jgi:hypothetical protein
LNSDIEGTVAELGEHASRLEYRHEVERWLHEPAIAIQD